MSIVDPREEFDDLLETTSRERLAPAEFDETAASEPATVGWVVVAFAFDAAGRVLLIDQPWAEGWLAPGGVPQPGESLAGAVTREVREETGVEITPARPYAVDEVTFEHEHTGATTGWTTVLFGAVAETTALDSDPGLADETITAVDWFDRLPEDVFNPDLVEPVYRRCRSDLSEPRPE